MGDDHFMRRALANAERAAGDTWPNPTVGACLVRDGRVIAEACHPGAGQLHAEALALAQAGEAARGATLYVTLEPCHHEGRTPPCSRAIAVAGVTRVVYAVADSNPGVRGGGATWLRAQGITVDAGALAGPAWELNHAFFETDGGSRMHVALKLAVSEDLRLARRRGRVENPNERRITGPVSHRVAHRLRSRAGCVLVGRGTLAADRPQLTVRYVPSGRQPGRAVVDSRLRLEPRDFARAEPGWLVLTGPSPQVGPRRALEAAGHEVIPCQTTEAGQLEWEAVLETLQSRHLGPLWVEGGAEVASSLIAGSFVDRLYVFQAPLRLGGDGPIAPSPWPPPWLESYRRCRRGLDQEWILRRRGLPGPPGWAGVGSEGD